MKKIVALFLGLIILNGCANYQLSGKTKKTVVDKISPNTVIVTFCGNAYMNQEEVEKYALQRASVEALSKGCLYFVVVKREDNSKMCALSSRRNKVHSYDVAPIDKSGNLDFPEFVEPNIALTIQCVSEEEGKNLESAINAEEFLSKNFPGMNN